MNWFLGNCSMKIVLHLRIVKTQSQQRVNIILAKPTFSQVREVNKIQRYVMRLV